MISNLNERHFREATANLLLRNISLLKLRKNAKLPKEKVERVRKMIRVYSTLKISIVH